MKLLYLKISIILCTLLLWTGMSLATSTGIFVGGTSNLTEYLKTAPNQPEGNKPFKDNEYNVNALVNNYNDPDNPLELPIDDNYLFELPENLTLLGKWNVGTGWDEGIDPGFTGSFTEDSVGSSGNWFATEGSIYYSFKAANDFALYYANGETNGDWTIDWEVGNNPHKTINPDLSHISFWTAEGNTNNQVPEPGTLALVGLGIATIAGYRRKRRSS